MKTTVGKAKMDIATGWAASLGVSIPTWAKGQEILVEEKEDGNYISICDPKGVIIHKSLLDFDI